MARELGEEIAKRGLNLVYGGGNVGLMGVVADAVLAGGAEVCGIIPQFLVDMEVAHQGLQKLIVVSSMHERKMKMSELSDAFVILPGGIGTFEEFFEVLTWAHLKLHQKPIILFNVGGYYDLMLTFLKKSHEEGFINNKALALVLVANSTSDLFEKITSNEHISTRGDFEKDKI